jgi:long-chain acyl-CoA synthetase
VEAVLRVVREAAPDAPLRRDANLELDLGLDSMERVELLTLLQQRLGTTLDEEVAQRIVTLADLASAFASARRAEAGASTGDAWEQVLGAAPPADEYLAELDHPKPVTAFVMWSALRVVAGLARLLLGFHVKGREHLPAAGPYLLCPNHESYLDGFLLGCALPFRTLRGIFFVGASEYFTTPLMRRLARAWNIVPVDPDANLVRAMQVGAYGLRRGGILVLFPEGERSIDGDVKTFRKGATILATRLKVPVVPAAFEGAFEVWPRSRPFNWRALLPWRGTRTTLRFGPPVPPETFAAPGTPPDDTRAAARLREIVVGLRARGV